ncbi:MAG: hypothetical protein OEZ33_08945 [Gammaproteobacteria bacterium]|nr:hypothetical protein [Gammaproteobacteria bacterium]MDH5778324.1 hypothetical protein [Gammaproteobacteria bacterium]
MREVRIQFKNLLVGLIIGLLLGLWFGVNIGKGRSLIANPFAKQSFSEKVKHKVGESVERIGKEIRGTNK